MSSSQTSSSNSDAHPLSPMLDLGIGVDVVVGTTWITVRDCLKLKRHSVVRLRRSSGSDLDVQVGGIVVASGEVVVVDESTAIRIADIAHPPGSEPEA